MRIRWNAYSASMKSWLQVDTLFFRTVAAVLLICGVARAQSSRPEDPAQPYLTPAPGTEAAGGLGPPPSPALQPESTGPQTTESEVGTDRREEVPVPSREPPVSGDGARGVSPVAPVAADKRQRSHPAYNWPPPRPQPRRLPSGRGAMLVPPFSVRIDPLETVLEGRAGLQLEMRMLPWVTLELTPLFLVSSAPPVSDLFAFNGRVDQVTQHSAGVGPIAGAAIALGLWPGGRSFYGYVVRAQLTNHGIEYRSTQADVTIDRATFTERRLSLTFGRAYRLGPIVIEGGIGLSYELNRTDRCALRKQGAVFQSSTTECAGEFLIATDATQAGTPIDLRAGMYPVALHGRFAIGVVVD